jgi:hypothetical protein
VTRFSIFDFSIDFTNFFKLSPKMLYLGLIYTKIGGPIEICHFLPPLHCCIWIKFQKLFCKTSAHAQMMHLWWNLMSNKFLYMFENWFCKILIIIDEAERQILLLTDLIFFDHWSYPKFVSKFIKTNLIFLLGIISLYQLNQLPD